MVSIVACAWCCKTAICSHVDTLEALIFLIVNFMRDAQCFSRVGLRSTYFSLGKQRVVVLPLCPRI